MASRTNLKLVSFDGGGVRGLSQLEIMNNIMHRLNWGKDPNDRLLPYQHFDLIGGSGTGGLIAIMLAKLRMSTEEATEEFCTIIGKVFAPVDITPEERLKHLRMCLEDIMKKKGLPLDMKLADEAQTDSCACFVVASLQNNVSSKIRLRSYPVRSHPILPITVIEAALASCATIPLFEPVVVGMGHKRKEYIAAGLGATNPIREVISEAHSLFGGDSTVASILSVGVGHPGIITLTANDGDVDVNRAMREMMNDCTQKAREVEDQMGQSGIYFRFSVEHGMQSNGSNAMDTAWIVTQTETYLEEQNKKLETFAKNLDALPRAISLDQLESGNVLTSADKISADGNTGRSDEIDKIVARLKPLGVDVNCPLGECMEGTREDILGAILNWVIDSSAANIFWLKGHPGVGKSAIAASLIEKLQSTRHLGSSFFFQRERFNVMTTSALWRTVACDLARRYPAVRKHLIAALEADKTLPITAKVDKLFRELIHKPLMAWEEAGEEVVSVIIVDALDECGGLDGQHSNHRINLIRTLKSWSILPKRFKLVVTSRAEPDILDLFSSTQHEPLEIPSGNVVNESSSKDIERFLEHQIGQIAARSHGALAPDWPGRQIIKELTQIAAGLFIWVETALRFLRRGEPQEQLNRILDGASMGGLASLYSSILQASFEEPSETTLESFHRVVGAIILAEEPLPASSLIQLCSVDPSTLSYIRNGLQSVMDPGEELMFSHESFVDFLFNPEECRSGFSIDVLQQSRHLTLRCFQVMKQNLRFNICDLKSSYESNDEIVDLEKRIEECITPSLIYSSSYWADHLAETNFDLEISRDIENFMQNQFLFWLEVLSLTQRVSFGTGMMAGLIEWLRIGGQDETMARDMKKFIARFGSLISQSVPHIYLSALPFAPRSSMVYMQYIKDYPQTIRIERGGQEDWPAIQNVLVENEFSVTLMGFTPDGACIIFHLDDGIIQMWDAETGEIVAEPFEANTESVSSVSFSPDGARIAFGSYDGTLRVWDAETQDMVAGPFEGHTSEIGSLTFSPDGMRIVSSSIDGEFRVWDAQSAEMITGPFKGHAESLTDVAFSPDGVFVASNSDSSDINFWVWDVATAQMVAGPFEGHTDVVNSVAFSPDGTHIVSGSSDKKVCVWDAKTAEMVIGSLQGHTDGVNSVAFSPDGTRVVSGSEDRTIRVWNAESGKMVAGPFKGHYQGVTSVSFSPDGTRIVSGSNDGTIRVWDAETIEIGADPFEGHKNRVNSVAFSPDGTRVVSGSEDGELWVWDAQSAERIAGPFEGDRNWASTVAFSSDGTHVTSGACLFDMAIRIWDVETAKMVGAGPFKKHTGFVGSVAFSPNGTYIVSGSHDGTVRVWNAETAQMVAGPLQGHTNQVKSVAFSPNGACVASGSYDRTLRVWDAKSGEMVAGPFEGHTHYVTSVAFSPDSIRVASGSWDKTIRVWDATTSRMVVGPLVGHTDRVSSVIFSPDGAYIASGSYDKTLRLWDAETAQMIAGPFEGHADCVASVAFSPDGTRIVSGSHDRTIRLWDAKNAQMIAHTSTGDTRWVYSAALSPNKPPAVSSEDRDHYLGNITTSSSTLHSFTDASKMVDGWILGPQSELLFWVPPSIRNGLFWPSTIFVIGERLVTKLNLEHFAHGEAWTHCRDPLPERGVDGLTVMTQAPTAGNAKRKVPLDGHEEERTSDASANKRSKVSRGSDSAKEP